MPVSLHPRPQNPRPHSPHYVPAGVMVGVECADGRLIEASDLARIEALDDTVFAALAGDPAALDQVADLWRRLKRDAPRHLVEESREQYIRHAENLCRQYRDEPLDTLGRAFAAVEILAMMGE